MRVAHRHLERLVAEQLGDAPERGAAHHQPRGERVSEVVPGEVPDLSLLPASRRGYGGGGCGSPGGHLEGAAGTRRELQGLNENLRPDTHGQVRTRIRPRGRPTLSFGRMLKLSRTRRWFGHSSRRLTRLRPPISSPWRQASIVPLPGANPGSSSGAGQERPAGRELVVGHHLSVHAPQHLPGQARTAGPSPPDAVDFVVTESEHRPGADRAGSCSKRSRKCPWTTSARSGPEELSRFRSGHR